MKFRRDFLVVLTLFSITCFSCFYTKALDEEVAFPDDVTRKVDGEENGSNEGSYGFDPNTLFLIEIMGGQGRIEDMQYQIYLRNSEKRIQGSVLNRLYKLFGLGLLAGYLKLFSVETFEKMLQEGEWGKIIATLAICGFSVREVTGITGDLLEFVPIYQETKRLENEATSMGSGMEIMEDNNDLNQFMDATGTSKN